SLQEEIVFGTDPIDALNLIPKFKEKLEICEALHAGLHNSKFHERVLNKIIASITYRDDFNKRHGIGDLEEWDIHISAYSHEITADDVLNAFDRVINSYKQRWTKAIKCVQDSADFQQIIDKIPSVEIATSNSTHCKQSVSALEELIKYTNLTAKTSFDKIGSFVVLDVETTGLSSSRDHLLEIAAIKFEDWSPVEKFHTLLNPGKPIPSEATAVNNITDEMVAEAPSFSQIIDCLNSFVGKSNIVGHNLPFDLKFLYRNGYDFTTIKRRYYDTCEISKRVLKKPKTKWDRDLEEHVINENYDYDVENYKLTTLCDFYKIRDNTFAHRALSDALATGFLFKHLAESKIDY
ncbi:MAG: 3'-5' exonuclease, partial [Oscillospiraceae bacterium]|nr:3'-5' exonuclease [Oscillospiraceae bacterium]